MLTVVVQLHRETYINTILRYTLRSTSGRRVSIQPSVSTNRYPVASTPTIISIQPSISIKRSVSSQSSLPTFSIIPTIGFNEAFNEQPSNRYPVASTPITISTQPSISIKRWNWDRRRCERDWRLHLIRLLDWYWKFHWNWGLNRNWRVYYWDVLFMIYMIPWDKNSRILIELPCRSDLQMNYNGTRRWLFSCVCEIFRDPLVTHARTKIIISGFRCNSFANQNHENHMAVR